MCFPASNTGFHRRNRNAYTCTDRESVVCRYDVVRAGKKGELRAPKNGILLRPDESPVAVIAGTQTSRDVSVVISGGRAKTYAFPNTVVIAGDHVFHSVHVSSVRLNEGLRVLDAGSFSSSWIRRLVLPSTVESIGNNAFNDCERLEYADLTAAHRLKSIDSSAFVWCKELR